MAYNKPKRSPVTVTWKDEGEVGPCTVYARGIRETEGRVPRPFGSPLPKGMTDKGWMTREEARQIAADLGARFVET